MAGWLLCTGVNLKGPRPTGVGLSLLDTATESGSLEWLIILGSGTGTSIGLGLLEITLTDAIIVSLVILSLGSGGQLRCGSFGEDPG